MSRARTLAGAIGSDGALNVADVAGLAAVASSGSASDLGTGTLPIARIADGAVTTAKHADASITAAKIASGAAVSNIGYTPVNKGGDTMSGPLGVGVFTHASNSGEARLGRADDRSVGVFTLQLGGTSGQRFEIVDKNWSSVLLSVEDNGTISTAGTLNVAGDLTASGYKVYRYRGGLSSSESITSSAVNSYSGSAYEGWWTLGFTGHSEGLEVQHMRGSCGTVQWYHSYGAKPAYRNKTDDTYWNSWNYF